MEIPGLYKSRKGKARNWVRIGRGNLLLSCGPEDVHRFVGRRGWINATHLQDQSQLSLQWNVRVGAQKRDTPPSLIFISWETRRCSHRAQPSGGPSSHKGVIVLMLSFLIGMFSFVYVTPQQVSFQCYRETLLIINQEETDRWNILHFTESKTSSTIRHRIILCTIRKKEDFQLN